MLTMFRALAVENTKSMKFLAFCLLQTAEEENKQNLQKSVTSFARKKRGGKVILVCRLRALEAGVNLVVAVLSASLTKHAATATDGRQNLVE